MSEVTSLIEAYRAEADVIFPIPELGDGSEYGRGEMTVSVHKLGGGTLGKQYDGTWLFDVHHNGTLIASTRVEHGMPISHLQAAVSFADFAANGETTSEPFGPRLQEWLDNYVSPSVVESVIS